MSDPRESSGWDGACIEFQVVALLGAILDEIKEINAGQTEANGILESMKELLKYPR